MTSKFDAVEALLEEARLTAAMPAPAERARLRMAAGMSRAHVAKAVGVGRQTVANWETGVSDPTPPARVLYLRLLEGLAVLHPAPADEPADILGDVPAALMQPAPEPAAPAPEPAPAPVESPVAAAARTEAYREQAARCGGPRPVPRLTPPR